MSNDNFKFVQINMKRLLYSTDSAYFVKSNPRAFSLSFYVILCRYATDILKMCMKMFDAEKIIFDKFSTFFT